MITKFKEIDSITMEKARGGEGSAKCYPYKYLYDTYGKIKMFNFMELNPHSSIGIHTHNDDFEIYIITEGTGMYHDNGQDIEVSAGDMLVCNKGECHGLKAKDTPIKFIAFIME